MKSLHKSLLFFLALTTAFAAPLGPLDPLLPRHETRILPRQQQQGITQPVTFQTVETSQTPVGTITETCKVTLTPITDSSGKQSIRQDKECTYVVLTAGESPPPPASRSGDNGQATTTTSADAGTTTTSSDASTSTPNTTSSSAPVTDTAAAPSTSSNTATTTPAEASKSSAQTSSANPANPAANASDSPAATSVTITSTLANGAVTTLTVPTAAQAQTSATQEEVPGRKLEVLPIGLGVFAGISVIALIVVGLVTYERTKYRRAFRQRKLAEAGANMGYGGMAERT